MLVHQVADPFVGLRGQQHQRRDKPEQVPRFVGDIAGVDRLLVGRDAADVVERVADGHLAFQLHKLGGHDAARAVVLKFEQLVDLAAILGRGVLQNALDHGGGHFLNEVGGVVIEQLGHRLGDFLVRQLGNQLCLRVAVHLDEDLRRQRLRQQPIELGERQFGILAEQLRNVDGVLICKIGLDRGDVAPSDHVQQFFNLQFSHGCLPSAAGMVRRGFPMPHRCAGACYSFLK